MTLDKKVVRKFWENYSKKKDNRVGFTSATMYEWELSEVSRIIPHVGYLLDLGSGHGNLSRKLINEKSHLLAVDWMEEYKASFCRPNESFICSPLESFETKIRFDHVLLFGVITHLNKSEEINIYKKIAKFLKPNGCAIVKNQCSIDKEFFINGYSEKLNSDYSARYPSIVDQQKRLEKYFSKVRIIKYPLEYNYWENSCHIMFALNL